MRGARSRVDESQHHVDGSDGREPFSPEERRQVSNANAWPTAAATGTTDTAAVYLVFEPGGALPEHTDSAEEWLLVLEGTIEASVGGETGILEAGQLALVPAIAPHGARNVGDGPARVLGFFGASTNVAHFSDELAPSVKTLVVGAEPPFEK